MPDEPEQSLEERIAGAGDPAVAAVNEYLYQRNKDLERQVDEMKQMLARPITVLSADSDILKKIGDYLPQLTHLSTNVSETASAVQKVAIGQGRVDVVGNKLDRIGDLLEQLIPQMPEGGPEPDDRYFHDAAGEPWDGRLCKRYSLVWTVFDPGDSDPCSPGDQCAASHVVWGDGHD